MSDRSAPRLVSSLSRALRFVARHPFALGVGLVLAVFLSAGLHFLERREEIAGERRYTARAELAATFVSSYIADLRLEQRTAARVHLSSSRIARTDFARLVEANRFGSAVLLNAAGRVEAAHPLIPGMIGARLTHRYRHLQEALAGRPAVSNVVSSAARGIPAVAIATPVRTVDGRGVLSTAYALSDSPLTAFLAAAMPRSEDDAYLIDAHGAIVASKGSERGLTRLADRDAALASVVSQRHAGAFSDGGEKRFFAVRRVAGTPWRLVATRPLVTVHPTWHGERRWMSVVLAVGLGASVLAIFGLFAGLLETRTRLLRDVARRERVEAELMRERALLAHRATHDVLTGLPNRALLFARMEEAYAHGSRDPDRRAAILFIDLDGFKSINDTHGHEAGDRVLTAVASRLKGVVRPSDTVSRLGGDEFAILCDPLLTSESLYGIADRIGAALERPIAIGDGRTVRVGASVGIAERLTGTGHPQDLLADADAAMYAAKVERRSRRARISAGVAL